MADDENPVNKNVIEKGKRGEYDLIPPLDYMILEQLTPEGTTMSGLYPLGTTIKEIAKTLHVSSNMASGRVRYMNLLGLTVKVKQLGSGTGKAWQRTAAGDALLKTWKETTSAD